MAASADALPSLSRALGYQFHDSSLLQQALTHRSAGAENYERLEYLGDGFLNFIVGDLLYREFPQHDEGDLSRLRASLVREETLASIGEQLAIGDYLVLGTGESRSGGFRRASILADAVEAVVGAVYLDGGFAAAREVCQALYRERFASLPDPADLKDAKTRLQEQLQAQGRPVPVYQVVASDGPAHRQRFTAECRLPDSGTVALGKSANRKSAEQKAARQMLEQLETPNA